MEINISDISVQTWCKEAGCTAMLIVLCWRSLRVCCWSCLVLWFLGGSNFGTLLCWSSSKVNSWSDLTLEMLRRPFLVHPWVGVSWESVAGLFCAEFPRRQFLVCLVLEFLRSQFLVCLLSFSGVSSWSTVVLEFLKDKFLDHLCAEANQKSPLCWNSLGASSWSILVSEFLKSQVLVYACVEFFKGKFLVLELIWSHFFGPVLHWSPFGGPCLVYWCFEVHYRSDHSPLFCWIIFSLYQMIRF